MTGRSWWVVILGLSALQGTAHDAAVRPTADGHVDQSFERAGRLSTGPPSVTLAAGDIVPRPGLNGGAFVLLERIRTPLLDWSGASALPQTLEDDSQSTAVSSSIWPQSEGPPKCPVETPPTREWMPRTRRWTATTMLGRGAQGEVWRAKRLDSTGQLLPGLFVLKRMFGADREPASRRAGLREAHFGLHLAGQRGITEFIEHFWATGSQAPSSSPPMGSGPQAAAASVVSSLVTRPTERADVRAEPVVTHRDLWLVFRDGGYSLQAQLYDIAAQDGSVGPSAFWRRVMTHEHGPAVARSVMRQLLMALNVAHMHNVLHRDIKPANVLVSLAATDDIPTTEASMAHDSSARGVSPEERGLAISQSSDRRPCACEASLADCSSCTELHSLSWADDNASGAALALRTHGQVAAAPSADSSVPLGLQLARQAFLDGTGMIPGSTLQAAGSDDVDDAQDSVRTSPSAAAPLDDRLRVRLADWSSAVDLLYPLRLYSSTVGPSAAEQTAEYAPPEARLSKLPFSPGVPESFDVWSAAMVWLEFLLATRPAQFLALDHDAASRRRLQRALRRASPDERTRAELLMTLNGLCLWGRRLARHEGTHSSDSFAAAGFITEEDHSRVSALLTQVMAPASPRASSSAPSAASAGAEPVSGRSGPTETPLIPEDDDCPSLSGFRRALRAKLAARRWQAVGEVPTQDPRLVPDRLLGEAGEELLFRMLSFDPNARPSAAQVLAHPFFRV